MNTGNVEYMFLCFSNIRLPETVPVPVCNLYEHSITGNAITNTKTNVELKDTHTHKRRECVSEYQYAYEMRVENEFSLCT